MKKAICFLLVFLFLVSCGPTVNQIQEANVETYINTVVPTSTTIIVEPTKTTISTVTTTASPTPASTPSTTPTTTPSTTPTSAPSATFTKAATPTESVPDFYIADCLPRNTQYEKGTVVEIIDGDTVDVRLENETVSRVRYIGIDAPEVDNPLYEEALSANSDLVLNKEAILLKDVSETDRFDRLLRYMIVGDVFVNLEMVKQGLAEAVDYPPDSLCASLLAEVMNASRISQIGIWMTTQTPEPSTPIVQIIDVNKMAEYVDIQNQGKVDVNLSGWNLVSEKGNQDCPLSGTIKAGETLRIWAMGAQEPGYSCGYDKTIWNNSEPDPAVLYNSEGVEVSRE